MDTSRTNGAYQGARSRVLFVSPEMPWPTVGGLRIRCGMLLRRALDEAKVDLVVVAPDADIARDTAAVPELPGLSTHIFADESAPGPAPDRASRSATELMRRLATETGGYDVVHLERHFLLPLVPPELRSRSVVVDYNIESQLLAQRAETGDLVSAAEINELRRRELSAWRGAGAVVALSPEDAEEMHHRDPAVHPHLIPNGWDHLPQAPSRPPDEGQLTSPRLFFVADYDYPPNRDAFAWLIAEVFPRIRERVPQARLVLAGKNLTPELARLSEECAGAELLGYVDNLPAELDRSDIVLCPLRIGGGVKVKMIEAIRRSCLLVSTTVGGIQGIPEPLRSAVCFADDADTFAGHVIRLCADPQERSRRRAELRAGQWAAPTWEESSVRMLRLWSRLSAKVDSSPCQA
ncbi:glycosyltransferase family 4 protein [Nocardia sp. NPDC023852]|uniref:glycosyltransferase family 4 protein n=1 Tax=Nocardia sp. NPDC023852 TaxID=3154697 RepID=UPI0033C23936